MSSEAIAPPDVAAVYEDHVDLLVGTAIERYNVTEADARALAHDVFVAYLLKSNEISNLRSWLVSSLHNAAKFYVRTRARHVALPRKHADEPDPQLRRIVETLPDQLAAREAFGCLTARCQLALQLRYIEGYSVPEIADALQTSPKYAAKLVARCLRQAHDRYGGGAPQ